MNQPLSQAPLTVDTMRADLARVLEMAPEEIGLDDDLIDLGLDSMRMLGLVLRWGETGIALEFSALAEHATLRGWAAVVARLQAAASPP